MPPSSLIVKSVSCSERSTLAVTVSRIPSTTEGQAASKSTVGVKVGSAVGVGVAVTVAVAVGRGVGVSGITSLVAVRQARVERIRTPIQSILIRDGSADISRESSTGWAYGNLAFCIQVLEENPFQLNQRRFHPMAPDHGKRTHPASSRKRYRYPISSSTHPISCRRSIRASKESAKFC